MEVEVIWAIFYILSILMVIGSGSRRRDFGYVTLGIISTTYLGLQMFNNVALFHVEAFIIFTGVIFFYGIIKLFDCWGV